MTYVDLENIKLGKQITTYKEGVAGMGDMQPLADIVQCEIDDHSVETNEQTFTVLDHEDHRKLAAFVIDQSGEEVEVGIVLGPNPGKFANPERLRRIGQDLLNESCHLDSCVVNVHLQPSPEVSDVITEYIGQIDFGIAA